MAREIGQEKAALDAVAEALIVAGLAEWARDNAQRNGTLQAGYFIMAARALGLDCGPMGGFDRGKVAAAFLDGRPWEVNFLINLGYGDASRVHPRNPRLPFARMAEVL